MLPPLKMLESEGPRSAPTRTAGSSAVRRWKVHLARPPAPVAPFGRALVHCFVLVARYETSCRECIRKAIGAQLVPARRATKLPICYDASLEPNPQLALVFTGVSIVWSFLPPRLFEAFRPSGPPGIDHGAFAPAPLGEYPRSGSSARKACPQTVAQIILSFRKERAIQVDIDGARMSAAESGLP